MSPLDRIIRNAILFGTDVLIVSHSEERLQEFYIQMIDRTKELGVGVGFKRADPNALEIAAADIYFRTPETLGRRRCETTVALGEFSEEDRIRILIPLISWSSDTKKDCLARKSGLVDEEFRKEYLPVAIEIP